MLGNKKPLSALGICLLVVIFVAYYFVTRSSIDKPNPNIFPTVQCDLGCWNGLYVGEADYLFVQEVFDTVSTQYDAYEYNGFQFVDGDISPGFDAQVYLRDDRLLGIILSMRPHFNVTLESIIAEMGNPDYAIIQSAVHPESLDGLSSGSIYYTDGYVFHLNVITKGDELCFANSSVPYRIHIVESGSIYSIIKDSSVSVIPSMSDEQIEIFSRQLQRWGSLGCL